MIGDPEVEVTCDSCSENVFVTPQYKYMNMGGTSGFYDITDESITEIVKAAHNWGAIEDAHYCEDCWKEMNE